MASGQDDPIELGPGPRTPRHVNRAVRAAQVNGEEDSIQVAHFTSDGQVASHPIPPAQLGRAATDYSSIDQDMNNNIPNAPRLVHDGLASSIHAPTTDTTTQLKGVAEDAMRILAIKSNVTQDLAEAFDRIANGYQTALQKQYAHSLAKDFISLARDKLEGKTRNAPQPQQQPTAHDTTGNHDLPKTWADRVRANGNPNRTAQLGITKTRRERTPARPPPDKDHDNRLFIRLDDKSPHTTAEPMSIRQTIATIIGKPISDVTSAMRTKTGWALRPRTREAHLAILNAAAVIGSHLGSTRIDEATKWYTYVIPRCPRSYMDCVTNTKHYTTDILKEEVERATGLTPIRTAASRHNDHESPTYNAVVSFLEKPSNRFKLFGTSGWSRIIDKPAAIPQCTNCWDFHPRRNCDRTPRCMICGKGEHNGACTTAPQCANCLGPHPADEPSCLMRPRRQNGKMVKPSRAERGRLRERGNQASRRANPPAPPSSPTIPPRSSPLGDRARSPMQPPPQLPTTATRPTKTRNLSPLKRQRRMSTESDAHE
jgi:hypothetical protein